MDKIGNLLVRKGDVTPVQLLEALRLQVKRGGRLGTNLAELQHVGLATLTRALGEQRGVPVALPEELEAIPSGALLLVPKEVAARHLAVPLRTESRTLVVAMTSAFDVQAVEALELDLHCHVRALLAAELAVLLALERFYGLELRKPLWASAGAAAPEPEQARGPSPLEAGDPSVFARLAPGQFLTDENDELYKRTGDASLAPKGLKPEAPKPVAKPAVIVPPTPPASAAPAQWPPPAPAPVPAPQQQPTPPASPAAAPSDPGPDWVIESAPAPLPKRVPLSRQVTEPDLDGGPDWMIEGPDDPKRGPHNR